MSILGNAEDQKSRRHGNLFMIIRMRCPKKGFCPRVPVHKGIAIVFSLYGEEFET